MSMGATHSTTRPTDASTSGGDVVTALLRSQAGSGDTAFHRAVRGAGGDAAAAARLQELCGQALQHHEEIQARLLAEARGPQRAWCSCLSGGSAGPGGAAHDDDDPQEHRSASEASSAEGATPQQVLRRLLNARNAKGTTVLHVCADLGYAVSAAFLLEQGANPWLTDRLGRRMPIHWACMGGHVECVKVLLDDLPEQWRKSPRRAELSYLEAPTLCGFTPLHCAAASGSVACVRAVLRHYPRLAVPSALDSWEYQLELPRGSTPLHVAAAKGHLDAARELLRYFNNMVLASQGRLVPSSTPPLFGGQLPAAQSPTPPDPRLVADGGHQQAWQVAQAAQRPQLAELLHPGTPLTFFFPEPTSNSALQTLASEVLKQKLAHTLQVAEQAEAQQRLIHDQKVRQAERERQKEKERAKLTHARSLPLSANLATNAAAAVAAAAAFGPDSSVRGGGGGRRASSGGPPVAPSSASAAVLMPRSGTAATRTVLHSAGVGEVLASAAQGVGRLKQALRSQSLAAERVAAGRAQRSAAAAAPRGGEEGEVDAGDVAGLELVATGVGRGLAPQVAAAR